MVVREREPGGVAPHELDAVVDAVAGTFRAFLHVTLPAIKRPVMFASRLARRLCEASSPVRYL